MIRLSIRLRRSIEKTYPPFLAVATGAVPRFVYGSRVDVLPVFAYHVVGPAFEQDLLYLQRGGYRTAGIEEVAANALGDSEPDGRTVALTFDDGDESVVRVAAPLLRRYGFRGIAFVVAGVVPPSSEHGLAGWAELRTAVATGALEVGSHSLFHHQVPVSPEIVGFVDCATDTGFTASIPIPRGRGDAIPDLGTPIYRGRPRYTAAAAFLPHPEGVERCRSFALERGEDLLRSSSGLRELAKLAPRTGTYETRQEADGAVEADMRSSFDRIGAECPNPAARHLCFPWYARTGRAEALAGRAGAALMFGGYSGRHGRRPDRPPLLQRLSPDLLPRLPGPDRQTLGAVLWRRARAIGRRNLGPDAAAGHAMTSRD